MPISAAVLGGWVESRGSGADGGVQGQEGVAGAGCGRAKKVVCFLVSPPSLVSIMLLNGATCVCGQAAQELAWQC